MAMTTLEFRKLVHKIRSFVNAADQTDDGLMAKIAKDYSQQCQEVNDRLTRCGELLEKGHRSEALALAEQPSDLLEFVSLCNFPEIDEWQELCAQYGWTRAASLLTSIAEVISEAYEMREQTNHLLTQNRLLALKKATIKDRLAVLRSLAKVDAMTSYWRDDVALFESVRAKEILELGNSTQKKGEVAVPQFLKEFRDEEWHTDIPVELQNLYANTSSTFDNKNVLPNLATKIASLFASRNFDQLQTLIEEWNTVVSRNKKLKPNWYPSADLLSKVNPAILFLQKCKEEQKRKLFFNDVRALHTALLQEDDVQKIEFFLAAAESHGFDLPIEVQAELARFRRGEDHASVVSTLLIIVLVIFGVSILVFAYLAYQAIAD